MAVGEDLSQLQRILYHSTEPDRRRLRPDLIAALQSAPECPVELERWARVVTYEFSFAPLSCAGSLREFGGRFNAGIDLDPNTLNPWPALYLAEDVETAMREKFQLKASDLIGGLTREELALQKGVSHSTVFVRGRLTRVFDMTTEQSLAPVAKILKKIELPAQVRPLIKKYKISKDKLRMVKTAQQLYATALEKNWRFLPAQHGLPAGSHVLAELIRGSGFEAIRYCSTKGLGHCLAIFPEMLRDNSFIDLIDRPPREVKHSRLDAASAADLSGWETVPHQLRPH